MQAVEKVLYLFLDRTHGQETPFLFLVDRKGVSELYFENEVNLEEIRKRLG
jgi:hypothetical protein